MIGRREPELDDGGPLFGVRPGMGDDEYDALAAFAVFHAENPHVYEHLHRRALAQVRRGVFRGSIARLVEDLRADPLVNTSGDDFKVNNTHRAHYARLLMRNEPELRGFFEVRASKADRRS